MGEIDWVSIIKDWGLVLVFLIAFILFIRPILKNSSPANSENAIQSQSHANNEEIMAAISAAVNEYRKNN